MNWFDIYGIGDRYINLDNIIKIDNRLPFTDDWEIIFHYVDGTSESFGHPHMDRGEVEAVWERLLAELPGDKTENFSHWVGTKRSWSPHSGQGGYTLD